MRARREQSLFWLLVVLTGGILLVGALLPRQVKIMHLEHNIERLEHRKVQLEQENHRLRLTLKALAAGRPDVWRIYIRQRLHYVKKGYRLFLEGDDA